MNSLDSDLLEAIGQINMAIWHTDKKECVTFNVPVKIRKEVMIFLTVLFSIFDQDLIRWCERQVLVTAGCLFDEFKAVSISGLTDKIEHLEKKLENKD